jgi:putative transposase
LDYISYWQTRTGATLTKILTWLSLAPSKYHHWKHRKNQENQHNSQIPKAHWLLPWEIEAIISYRFEHPAEGYRLLSFMMLDDDIVAVSPSSVYRALLKAGLLLTKWNHRQTKGSGFHQPSAPHHHWHLDISYINFKNTFVYLVALIDGYSRFVVHYELKLSVEALDMEILMERAREKFPGTNPILITDNGPQFIANEFKAYLQLVGITHRKTRFYYPQSNGKIERFYQTCKNESIRKNSFLSFNDLNRQLASYIKHYNYNRLHSSIGYIAPWDMIQGNQEKIFAERKQKLKLATENRIKLRKKKTNINSLQSHQARIIES